MTPELVEADAFPELFAADRPLLDVRAEVEFAKGAFPGAVNFPILTTMERERVGTCYKHSGPEAAVALGHKLVCGPVRGERVRLWTEFARRHPDGALYCFRGGLRSRIAQTWLAEAGVPYPRVAGGYKALRQFLVTSLEHDTAQANFVVVGGRTGSGKTVVLKRAPSFLDLEALANHRGSAFGGFPEGQPSPVDFENRVAISLMKLIRNGRAPLAVEDEGPNIGSLSVPRSLFVKISTVPLIIVEESGANRVENILQDYVIEMLARYGSASEPRTWEAFSAYLSDSVMKISKRLGGTRTAEILEDITAALDHHKNGDDATRHREWIVKLLDYYYDPLYDSQLERKRDRIAFQGPPDAVTQYLAETR